MLKNSYSTKENTRNIKQIKTNIKKVDRHKIYNLLSDSTVSKFVIINGIEVSDLSGVEYSVNKNLRFKTSVLNRIFCDYGDAYIAVKETKIC